MRRRTPIALILGVGALPCLATVTAAEPFHRLTGAQIQAKLAGMEMSDDVHWRDKFERDGTLNSHSMGRKATGKWWVKNNEICIDRGKDLGGCYQVWLAGRKVEFRREGLDTPVLDGTLHKPSQR